MLEKENCCLLVCEGINTIVCWLDDFVFIWLLILIVFIFLDLVFDLILLRVYSVFL